MRTTITLDSDVAAKVEALARQRGISFEQALNSALRSGLARGDPGPSGRYRLATQRLGLRSGIDLRHALRLAGEIEDAETVRRFQTGT